MKVIRFLFFLLLCGTLHAHLVLESEVTLHVEKDRLTGTAEADPAYLLAEFRPDDNLVYRDLAWLRALGAAGREDLEKEISRHWHDRRLDPRCPGRTDPCRRARDGQ